MWYAFAPLIISSGCAELTAIVVSLWAVWHSQSVLTMASFEAGSLADRAGWVFAGR
jgi:hypothetical protein